MCSSDKIGGVGKGENAEVGRKVSMTPSTAVDDLKVEGRELKGKMQREKLLVVGRMEFGVES